MKSSRMPLVVANWKMNPKRFSQVRALAKDIRKEVARVKGVHVAIAAPFVYIPEVGKAVLGTDIALAAQDVFYEETGAYTGEVSYTMLKSIDVVGAIIGHSERRAQGESDEEVQKKVRAVLAGGGTAIICVGEIERDRDGQFYQFVEGQVRMALRGIEKADAGRIVIAYEPIWAIGTGNTATPEDAREMKLFIQKVLSDLFGRAALEKVRVIYGGSVTKQNAAALMKEGGMNGFLVGGASLRAAEFGAIVKSAEEHS